MDRGEPLYHITVEQILGLASAAVRMPGSSASRSASLVPQRGEDLAGDAERGLAVVILLDGLG